MVYFGYTIGSVIGAKVFQFHAIAKYALMLSLTINAVSLFGFSIA